MNEEIEDDDIVEYDSGPFCKHWSDPETCEECKAEYDPYPEFEKD